MAITIWKYPLLIQDVQTIAMPRHATILCVQVQHAKPCLWVMVDPDLAPISRHVFICGTGHEVANPFAQYIGTFQLEDGAFVFHVFAEKG